MFSNFLIKAIFNMAFYMQYAIYNKKTGVILRE